MEIQLILFSAFIAISVAIKTEADYFYNVNRPLIIASRGASGLLPENTLPALKLAVTMKADFISTQVVMTKDEKFIIHHDPGLDRVTDCDTVFPNRKTSQTVVEIGEKIYDDFVKEFTFEEIQKLRVHTDPLEVYNTRVYDGKFGVPVLTDLIETIIAMNKERRKLNPESTVTGIMIDAKYPNFFGAM